MLNAHWETVIPSMFFKVKGDFYSRERLELEDGDFLDLDWIRGGSHKCMIITHGLEGDSQRFYVKRTAHFFKAQGWDVLAWNCRSCSGEMNRLPRFYHHGDTPDLHRVVQHVLGNGYQHVVLAGYSMGGSMSLKYLGEAPRDHRLKGAVTFSVPCNLRDSAVQLQARGNRMYEQRFLKKLIEKIKLKAERFEEVDASGVDELPDFDAFHDRYTAPLHGFADKDHFFREATCDRYFEGLDVPVLVVNAANDPMLGQACYPKAFAQASDLFHLEIPKYGGHAGFSIWRKPYSYMELRALRFIKEVLAL